MAMLPNTSCIEFSMFLLIIYSACLALCFFVKRLSIFFKVASLILIQLYKCSCPSQAAGRIWEALSSTKPHQKHNAVRHLCTFIEMHCISHKTAYISSFPPLFKSITCNYKSVMLQISLQMYPFKIA